MSTAKIDAIVQSHAIGIAIDLVYCAMKLVRSCVSFDEFIAHAHEIGVDDDTARELLISLGIESRTDMPLDATSERNIMIQLHSALSRAINIAVPPDLPKVSDRLKVLRSAPVHLS